MKRFRSLRLLLLAGAVVLAAGGVRPAHAQDPDDQTRGVARISLMDGEVSVKRGDASDWVAGVINAPLLSADSISTAPNSRAEVQFDSANLMRLGGGAVVNLATIEYGRYQLELAHGTLTYVVLRPSSANVEVDTPSVSVRPSNQGVYRMSVNDAGETQVIVRAGEVEVFTPRGSQWVSAGQMLMARGSTDPEFQIVNAPATDDWDRWNQSRDQAMLRSSSYRYVPQGVYGTEDLDSNGTWNNVAPYGNVWTPGDMAPGWAPYRNGRWVWEDWYGWTWVSYDPWGWAPYHYGRWFWDTGFGWCWYPGVIGPRHYWSPALVAWFGFGGPGVGVGFGFGSLGWVPLAPYEVFHPWWGRGFYGRPFNERINVTNINVTNVYRNSRFNGVSGMPVNDFRAGRFNAIGRVSGEQIRAAGAVSGRVPVAPSNANLQFANRGAGFVPRNAGSQRFFAHQQPAAVQRTPFAQHQRGFESQPGRTFGTNAAPSRPAVTGRGGFQGQQPAAEAGGWPRFGRPGEQGSAAPSRSNRALENTRPPSAAGGQNSGGWSRFGEPRNSSGPAQAAPRSSFQGGSGFGSPRYSAPAPASPPAVRDRPSVPSYSAPRQSAPSYSAPRSAPSYSPPSYSAPRSAPSYSAPRGGGGGGGFSAPRGGGGGGGGSAPHGGGGGGGHASGGGHGRK
jgi:hypothetical protein